MTSPSKEPLCFQCKHFHEGSSFPYTCDAYPVSSAPGEGGIPAEIIGGLWGDHTKPMEGDHGIQYEPKDSVKGVQVLKGMVKKARK